MPIRFRRSIRLGKLLRLNLGKRGAGVSAGVKGFHVGTGTRGPYVSAGIPGTGLSAQTYLGKEKPGAHPARVLGGVLVALVVVLLVLIFLLVIIAALKR